MIWRRVTRVTSAARRASGGASCIHGDALSAERTRHALTSRSSADLLRAVALFELAGVRPLVNAVSAVLNAQPASPLSSIAPPLSWIVRRTVFGHFAAGESFDECAAVCDRLHAERIGAIVDHSTEELEVPSAWARNAAQKRRLLERVATVRSCKFVPLKLTSLCSPRLLETISAHLQAVARQQHSAHKTRRIRCFMLPEYAARLLGNGRDCGFTVQTSGHRPKLQRRSWLHTPSRTR